MIKIGTIHLNQSASTALTASRPTYLAIKRLRTFLCPPCINYFVVRFSFCFQIVNEGDYLVLNKWCLIDFMTSTTYFQYHKQPYYSKNTKSQG